MIRRYIERALHHATYEKLEDGGFVAEVPGLQGVIATAVSLEDCRETLDDMIEEWVLIRVSRGLSVPAIDGITVAVAVSP